MELKELLKKLSSSKPGINIHAVVMPDIHTDYVVSLLKLPKNTPVFNLAKMSGTFEQRLTSLLISLVNDDIIQANKNTFFGLMESLLRKMAPDNDRFRGGYDVKYPIPPFAASIIMSFIQHDEHFPSSIVIRIPDTDLALTAERLFINMSDYYDENLKPINVIFVLDKKNYQVSGDALYVLDVPTLHYLKIAPLNMYRVSEGRPLLGYIYSRARKYPDDIKKLDRKEFYLLLLGVVMADTEASSSYYRYLSEIIPDVDKMMELARFFGIVDENNHLLSYTFVSHMLTHMPEGVVDTFLEYVRDMYMSLPLEKRPMFADAVGTALYFIGDKRYVLWRILAMRGYRNIGEYTFAIHRGILALAAGKKRTKRILIELERLSNMQRYVPPEFEAWESKMFSLGSPVHMFHYTWMKNAYFEEGEQNIISYKNNWRELKSAMCTARYVYVLAILIANDIFTGSISAETSLIARELEHILKRLEDNVYVSRDLITYGYLALALFYEMDHMREKAISTYSKLTGIARDKEVYIVEAIAHNNTGVILTREDLSLRSYERFYRLGVMSLVKSGGASGLMSVAMLNYLSIVKSYEKKEIVDNLFDSFRLFVFPKTIERNRKSYYVLKADYLLLHGYMEEAMSMEQRHLRGATLSDNMLDIYGYFLISLAYKTGDLSYLDVILSAFEKAGKELKDNKYLYMAVRAIQGDNDVPYMVKKDDEFSEGEKASILKLYYWSKKDINMLLAYQKKLVVYNTQVGDTLGVAEEEYEMGLVYKQMGNYNLAYTHLRRAYEIYNHVGSRKMSSVVAHHISTLPAVQKHRSFVFDAMVMEMFINNIVKIATLSAPDRIMADVLDMLISLTPAYRGVVGLKNESGWVEYAARDIAGNIDILPQDFHIPSDIVPEHAHISTDCSTITMLSSYKDGYIVIHLEDPLYGGGFEERDATVVEHVAAILPSIIEDMELKRRSLYDSLTGLYARWYLLRRLEEIVREARRDGSPVSVLFIDVDHFKEVNDKYGHDVGDMILKAIANAIKHAVRSSDIVGRYGGDEMVIVMRHATLEDATAVAERVRRSVLPIKEKYVEAEGISLSIGIASSEIYGYDAERLLKAADSAMYRAKALGKNRIHIAHD